LLKKYGIVRESSRKIDKAVRRTIEAYKEGRIEQEPAITDRLLGAMEESLNGFKAKGFEWQAKTLTDRGKNSQESTYGADFMVVLSVDIDKYKVNKGFLAQAKRSDVQIKNKELNSQCEKMLELSPDSFVFLYGKSGITVVPAISVVHSSANLNDLYSRDAARFFEEFFECFIGDQRICAPSIDVLQSIRETYHSRQLIYLEVGPCNMSPNLKC